MRGIDGLLCNQLPILVCPGCLVSLHFQFYLVTSTEFNNSLKAVEEEFHFLCLFLAHTNCVNESMNEQMQQIWPFTVIAQCKCSSEPDTSHFLLKNNPMECNTSVEHREWYVELYLTKNIISMTRLLILAKLTPVQVASILKDDRFFSVLFVMEQ